MKFLLTSCAAALLAALSQSAAAQAPQTTEPEDEIIVFGQYLSIDGVNAVKTPTPIINVPQSLSIISADDLKNQAFTSLGDILRYTPGLSVSQGEGHRDAIIIRGQQTTADFFIDGLRDDVEYFRPLYNLEQVEILRGSNALLFGRGGGGGIVNRVSKTPGLDEKFTDITAALDTFGAYAASIDANAPLGERAAFRLNAFTEGLNNHRDFFDGQRFAVNPTLFVEIDPQTTLDLSYEFLNDERVVDRGVPSENVDGGPDVPIRGFDNTFFGSPKANETALTANIVRARVEHKFTDSLRGNVTAQYADYDKLYQNIFASEEVEVSNGVIAEAEFDGYRDNTDRQNTIIQANLIGEFQTGGLGHTLLIGAELGQQGTANSRFDNVFAQNGRDQLFIPFSDPLIFPEFGFTRLARDRASDVETLSAYVQDQIDLTEQLKILIGARFDRFDIGASNLISGAQFSRKDEEITPRLGVIYKPAQNVSFYGSYGQTFLPRSGDQFQALDLNSQSTRPQFFENKEIGAKWDINPALSLTTAIFELERESFTTVDPSQSDRLLLIDGSVTKGFEAQLSGALTDAWSVTAGYGYLDGKVERAGGGGFDGNSTRQTPEHMVSIWNKYQLSDQLGVGLGATYQDGFFVNEDNSVRVPGYTRVDAAVFYDFSQSLRVQMNIENLLDVSYYPDAHSNDNISTGKPQSARFTLAKRFE